MFAQNIAVHILPTSKYDFVETIVEMTCFFL